MNRPLPLSIAALFLVTPAIASAQTAEPAPQPPAATGASPGSATPPTGPAAPLPNTTQTAPVVPGAAPAAPTAPAAPAAPSTGAAAAAPSGGTSVDLMSLKLMRDKGVISQAEYESAVKDLTESTGTHAGEQTSVVVSKWAVTMYGFVEADNIYDTTRAYNELPGNALIPRANTQGGENPRFQMGARNSRIGFRVKAPEIADAIRASAMLEMDFLGNQPGTPPTTAVSEGGYFTSPTFRVRHMNLKVETPVVDIMAGQYWNLFGWQSAYQPNTVEIQGVPGEVYSRNPQLRISKTIKMNPVTLEIAVAAVRPVQRDSGTPDGQAGLRLALDSWTGMQTVGSTGTQIAPLSIAVTGLLRHVAVDNFSATPTSTNDLGMGAVAVDGFIPVLPGTKEKKDNALSLTGEFATGSGFADMYTGLSGGAGFPTLPLPAGAPAGTAATPFAANIDSGIVTYDANGNLHPINWQSYMIGAQYYLPGMDGKLWVSGNYSHMFSDNIHLYGTASKLMTNQDWFDVNLFVDPTPAVRVGIEYANTNQMYADGQHAINHRGQLSGFYIF